MPATLIVPPETCQRLAAYAADLFTGQTLPGTRLAECLAATVLTTLDADALLHALLDTKEPCIFAESAVRGDGSDWTLRELGLLGDISVLTEVTVYDDGRHRDPAIHSEPFPGTLLFTPGALLRNDTGRTPADWDEVVTPEGELNLTAYRALYARRLTPVFDEIQRRAARRSRRAVVTIPGLGCGQFAGPFRGQLGAALRDALTEILRAHAAAWSAIALVYYDPFKECSPTTERIQNLDFRVRPLMLTPGGGLPQLCHPKAYAEGSDDFSDCDLFSLVAWDHVSWPGNDFNGGSRSTDDGVKAAATSALHALTGIAGHYVPTRHAYQPSPPHETWSELLDDRSFPRLPEF